MYFPNSITLSADFSLSCTITKERVPPSDADQMSGVSDKQRVSPFL
jgi:hypothetical protein